MLGPRAQLGTDAPALRAQIGPDRRIAVVAVVGPTHAGLARLAVVQTKHIGMQRDMPARLGAHARLEGAQQRDDCRIGHPGELLGLGIEALAQSRRGGHLTDPQRAAEEAVLAYSFDRLEIVLPGTQQPEVGAKQIDVRDPVAQRYLPQALLESAVAVDQLPDQRQAAVRGVDLLVTLL